MARWALNSRTELKPLLKVSCHWVRWRVSLVKLFRIAMRGRAVRRISSISMRSFSLMRLEPSTTRTMPAPSATGSRRLAVVGVEWVAPVGLDELLGQVADLRMGLEPLQDGARVLEARGVDELDHLFPVDDDRVEVGLGGGARALIDGDAVVFGQGGDHGGLARIGVAHDRQPGDLNLRVRHRSSPSSPCGASISSRR